MMRQTAFPAKLESILQHVVQPPWIRVEIVLKGHTLKFPRRPPVRRALRASTTLQLVQQLATAVREGNIPRLWEQSIPAPARIAIVASTCLRRAAHQNQIAWFVGRTHIHYTVLPCVLPATLDMLLSIQEIRYHVNQTP